MVFVNPSINRDSSGSPCHNLLSISQISNFEHKNHLSRNNDENIAMSKTFDVEQNSRSNFQISNIIDESESDFQYQIP